MVLHTHLALTHTHCTCTEGKYGFSDKISDAELIMWCLIKCLRENLDSGGKEDEVRGKRNHVYSLMSAVITVNQYRLQTVSRCRETGRAQGNMLCTVPCGCIKTVESV